MIERGGFNSAWFKNLSEEGMTLELNRDWWRGSSQIHRKRRVTSSRASRWSRRNANESLALLRSMKYFRLAPAGVRTQAWRVVDLERKEGHGPQGTCVPRSRKSNFPLELMEEMMRLLNRCVASGNALW